MIQGIFYHMLPAGKWWGICLEFSVMEVLVCLMTLVKGQSRDLNPLVDVIFAAFTCEHAEQLIGRPNAY